MRALNQVGALRWRPDTEGIVTVVLDDPDSSTNMITDRHLRGMDALLHELENHSTGIRGLVVTSAKRSFFSGPEFDLSQLGAEGDPYGHLIEVRDQLTRLSRLPFPVVAVLAGSALGGGFEIALACHRRIGVDDPELRWALAESAMGLLPAGGGTVRVARMLGLDATVREVVGGGRAYGPRAALGRGLVDELVATPESALTAARRWISSAPVPPAPVVTEVSPEVLDALRADAAAAPSGTRRALEEIIEVARLAVLDPSDDAFEAETAAFRRLLAAPAAAVGATAFAGFKRIHDRVAAGRLGTAANGMVISESAMEVDSPFREIFLPGSPARIAQVRVPVGASPRDIDAAVATAASSGVPIVVVGDGSPDALDRAVVEVLTRGLCDPGGRP